jgi:CDP-diacylglycerol--glycerol-3-phosphate 3-phosphatidyltransferase
VSTPTVPAKRFGRDAVATPANAVTVARLLLAIPTLILIAEQGATWLTVSLWFVLSCTDGVDGWLARRDGTTSSGAFLDPLADKFMTIGALVALVVRGDVWWLPVALIAAREVFVSVYRSAAARRGISLPARPLGKWKAFLQMLAVGAYVFPPVEDLDELKLVILWVAVVFTIVSGYDIVRRGGREAVGAG